ncbi:tetratricopeptide repeat protein [Nannocystis pusilla]|uniref:Tetratricopeptide repeat protein n=1 Tax=Nannocystis pusilla TaxID=889268 RepID=A0A9X3IXQ9_9BACT|nr:tetratricopeptide repeat protein [Nannocystis pusilla]MCY1008712.1 tetratricopeptide repeat protein [Nannocystis pusilla]
MADTSSRIPDEQGFDSAAAAVRSEPERADRWDQVEALGEPERAAAIAALYREILAKQLTPAAATVVGQRAVAFFEEWFPGDEAALTEVLRRVLAVQPGDGWAFQRLTGVLTLNERWSELLALYDQVLAAGTLDEARRIGILEEATDIARDFAGQPDHAVDYMQQLLALRPSDTRLEAALERLLEKQARHRDLISLYKRRIGLQGREATAGLPVKIAELWLDRLAQPGEALEELRGLLKDDVGNREAWALLERILVLDEASTAVRTGALDLLRTSYDAANLPEEVIRILGVALGFAEPQAAIGLHRELAERLVTAGRPAAAMEHYVAVVGALPGSESDHRRLRHLAELHGEHALHVKGLAAAAASEADAGKRAALWAEAGDVHRESLADDVGAIGLYQQVLGEPQADRALALRVARLLDVLLAQTGQAAERLTVLERLGELESGPTQTTVLGEAAKLALGSGDAERSLKSWRARLALDAEDAEALTAAIAVLEGLGRWGEVVDVLRQRAGGPVPEHQRRADLVRVAEIQAEHLADLAGAIVTWQEIVRGFGESEQTVESLASLLAEVTRWPDLADLLDRAAGRGTARLADLSTRLGDVCRTQLDAPGRAVACYDTALTADPAHEGARAGLLATLETEARAGAVEVLGKLYRGRGEWADLAAIVDARLAAAEGDAVKQVDILRETARLHEAHTGDKPAAVAALARAFPLAPADRSIERDLLRLSEGTGDFAPAATAFHQAAAAPIAGEPHRATELRLSEARLAEHKLGDAARALAAYQAVLSATRSDAEAVRGAIRTAAAVGDFSAAAHALLGQIVGDQKIDDATFALVEGLAGEHAGWDRLTLSLEAAANAGKSSLTPELYAFVAARVAQWHRDKRSDVAAAREALLRSVAAQPGHRERLRTLADLQRAAPEPALIDTLLALDGLSETDFDPLYEASELALGLLGDTDITRDILQRLLGRAIALWSRGVATTGARSNDVCVGWSAQKLSQLHEQDGDRKAAAELLAKVSTLPFDQPVAQDMRVRAAAIFTELGDRQRAIGLYEVALDSNPDDLAVLRLLGPLLQAEERFPELLKLRKHELSKEPDAARRLELRLEIARLVGVIEQRGGRVEALRSNLHDDPSHDPSLAALTEILADKASPDELAKFLGEHAARLEQVDDKPRAVRLWTQLAELAERRIGDVELALSSHRRAASLAPNFHNLDALARLHVARNEPAEAVPWLTERLVRTPEGAERTDIVLGLASALLGAGRNVKAIEVLTRAVSDHPAEARTRDLLIKLVREAGDWERLASLLQVAAEHTEDREVVLAFLYEAAAIVRDRLGELDRAIPVLERLHTLVPDDRGVLAYLADALVSGERWADAQGVLERLLADFGRRRPPERARVHYKLAQVARALGDTKAAVAQLELATAIDVGDVASLQLLAELSRDTGDLARAERSYRALLLAARRRGVDGDERLIGIAEAQYELSRLAEGRGQTDLAQELLGSAIEAALQDDREARKLQRALRSRGDAQLLVRVLRSRLAAAQDPAARASVLGDLADALDATGQAEEALGLKLEALQQDPGAAALQQSAAEQAARLGQSARYVDAVLGLVDRARRKQDANLQADLLLRAADIVERELADHPRAAELYGRVEAGGQRVVEAWLGLARIAAARGDTARQVELLERITNAPDDAMSPEVRARGLRAGGDPPGRARVARRRRGGDAARAADRAAPRPGRAGPASGPRRGARPQGPRRAVRADRAQARRSPGAARVARAEGQRRGHRSAGRRGRVQPGARARRDRALGEAAGPPHRAGQRARGQRQVDRRDVLDPGRAAQGRRRPARRGRLPARVGRQPAAAADLRAAARARRPRRGAGRSADAGRRGLRRPAAARPEQQGRVGAADGGLPQARRRRAAAAARRVDPAEPRRGRRAQSTPARAGRGAAAGQRPRARGGPPAQGRADGGARPQAGRGAAGRGVREDGLRLRAGRAAEPADLDGPGRRRQRGRDRGLAAARRPAAQDPARRGAGGLPQRPRLRAAEPGADRGDAEPGRRRARPARAGGDRRAPAGDRDRRGGGPPGARRRRPVRQARRPRGHEPRARGRLQGVARQRRAARAAGGVVPRARRVRAPGRAAGRLGRPRDRPDQVGRAAARGLVDLRRPTDGRAEVGRGAADRGRRRPQRQRAAARVHRPPVRHRRARQRGRGADEGDRLAPARGGRPGRVPAPPRRAAHDHRRRGPRLGRPRGGLRPGRRRADPRPHRRPRALAQRGGQARRP